MTYYNFEVWIRAQPGSYLVFVTDAPSGPASGVMQLDLAGAKMQSLLPTVLSKTEDAAAREEFGELLFTALFNGPILKAWIASLARARAVANQGLRLRLWIDAPELGVLPWELLYDKPDFLAVSGDVLISRFLPAGEPPAFVTPEKARVLFVIQEPANKPILAEVIEGLETTLSHLQRFAAAKVLKNATLAEINNELLKGYEVLHYMGHGASDRLLLATDKEVTIRDGHEFAALFTGQAALQLVVLNVCGSGATTTRGVFSGLGPFLSEKRLPAVVAMQYDEVFQRIAGEFNASFYSALDQSQPVDAAVNAARRALILSHPAGRDWSTPVLYMTTRAGRILEFVDNPVQAAIRDAELAKEQVEREKVTRETVVSLGEIAAGLRGIEDSMEILRVARVLRQRLNAIPGTMSTAVWKPIRQMEISDLQSKVKGTVQESSDWWLRLLPASDKVSAELNASNSGRASTERTKLEDALDEGIAESERLIDQGLRQCQTRSAAAVARFRIE